MGNTPNIRFKGFTDDWEQRKLGETLKYEQPGAYIVDSTDYDDSYETHVLTAGQSFILGYTNETDGIKNASPDNPVIIFDDFTTSSHFVDFPFKVKSSAMKLLTLKDESDDIYCINNILKNVDYVPASHERHWISIFSEFDVTIPHSKDEQKKIGDYFRNLDHLITLHQRKCDETKKLKKFMLQKMFPKKDEKKPEIRFAGFTDDWEQRKLGETLKYEQPGAYIVDSTDYDDSYETPVLTAGQSFILGYTNETDGIKNASPDNPVIIFDDFTTSSHFVDFPFKVKSSAMKLLTLKDESDDIYCINNILKNVDYVPASHERHWISIFSEFDVTIPHSKDEQKKIGDYFRNLDHLITLHQRKCDEIKEIKKFMLKNMFPQKG
ncbi:MAG: restriction endonuclease subunit S [Lachnospira eligens]